MKDQKISVLLGDIGGTNSRLRLVYMSKEKVLETIDEKDYQTNIRRLFKNI